MTMDNLPDFANNPHQLFCLRWNNHSSNFIAIFEELYKTESLTDVTLSTPDGPQIKCHKMVLAASSPYFHEMFIKNPIDQPVCIFQGIKYHELRAIIDYVYLGEVSVTRDMFQKIMEVARDLKIKGLDDAIEKKPYDELKHPVAHLPTDLSSQIKLSTTPNNGFTSPSLNGNLSMEAYGASFGHNMRLPPALWNAFSGLAIPQLPIAANLQPRTSYESISDQSPLSRKKQMAIASRENPILRDVLAVGRGEEMNSDRMERYSNGNSSPHDSDRRSSNDYSESMPIMDIPNRRKSSPRAHREKTRGPPGNQRNNGDWKRYKQYSREDISCAMDSVKEQTLSALQAAKKYGVPSRTLYDKLKKAGIVPSRTSGRRQSTSTNSESARFPYPTELNGSVYGGGRELKSEECEEATNGSNSMTDDASYYNSLMMQAARHTITQQARQMEQLSMERSSDREDSVMDMSTRSSPPSPRRTESDSMDDQVEDLSINRVAAELKLIPRSAVNGVMNEEPKKESDDPVPPV